MHCFQLSIFNKTKNAYKIFYFLFQVHSALLSGDPHDQLAIAYHLIIDNKRIADEAAKAELKDFYVCGSPPPVSFSPSPSEFSNSPLRPHPERIAPLRDRVMVSNHTADRNRGTPVKRAKWHLGIRSQSKPNDIMMEVYRAMKALDYEWKVINPYHVKVRHKNPIHDRYVKMTLQLYQVCFNFSFYVLTYSLPWYFRLDSSETPKFFFTSIQSTRYMFF